MKRSLRRGWICWGIIVALSLVCLAAIHIAGTFKTSLVLRPGEEVRLHIPSLLGHQIPLALEFSSKGALNERSKVLGGIVCEEDSPGNKRCSIVGPEISAEGTLNGGPIVKLTAASTDYVGQGRIGRSLITNLNTPYSGFVANPGINTLVLRVVSVDQSLLDEAVELVARSPADFKRTQPGYEIVIAGAFLMLLIWPVLAIWALVLLFLTLRARRNV